MRRSFAALLLLLALATPARAVQGFLYKVLPQFLDQDGRESLTPSLYDRDAYQAVLRAHPEKRGGLRFAVQWKLSLPQAPAHTLRVELRGTGPDGLPSKATFELPLPKKHAFSHWEYLKFDGDAYRKFGEMSAWRVTLWEGDKLLGEQKSFLW